MMRILAFTSLISVIATACGDAPAPAAAPAPGSSAVTTPTPTSIVDPYITIQETLAKDSLDALPELAARVVTASEPLQEAAGISAVIAGAGRLPATDIETARVAFEKMSMGLITYLKANPAERADLEVIHCTMAFNNKGAYWVQRKGDVNNPYHGKMMLRCGEALAWDQAPG
ncbi:MAG: DUF3347 domain-containing protein [Nannocystis sp.]|nr:DUF3347 domain-containing protein [Nannocystis sp.]